MEQWLCICVCVFVSRIYKPQHPSHYLGSLIHLLALPHFLCHIRRKKFLLPLFGNILSTVLWGGSLCPFAHSAASLSLSVLLLLSLLYRFHHHYSLRVTNGGVAGYIFRSSLALLSFFLGILAPPLRYSLMICLVSFLQCVATHMGICYVLRQYFTSILFCMEKGFVYLCIHRYAFFFFYFSLVAKVSYVDLNIPNTSNIHEPATERLSFSVFLH